MYSNLPYKTKQFFFVLIKLSIVVGAFYFIYQKLLKNDSLDFNRFLSFLSENELFLAKNIIFLLILTILNWFFEIIKWRFLVSKIKRLSVLEATEQSLGALTASLFTPNRIGEYGAKAIYYSKPHRKRILLLNLISNMMQMSITVILGVIGAVFLFQNYKIELDYFRLSRGLIVVFIIASLTFFGVKQNKYSIKGFPIEKIRDFVFNLGASYLIFGLFLSLVRYAIFSFQFYVILSLLGVDLGYFDAMIIITSMYLLASIIPTISIFDVVIKGSVAIYLFDLAGVAELPVLSCVLLMWLLNFAIPSIFGSYYVLNFNLPKTEN
ncbi:lysylphosphatidylglycerol synthase domain-containing protein [Olleya aquimaris]|uniref:Lysylphosphatidylglycerol synthase-like protein n=1 Tax=Olleya aquimaris TaxID=639310 RepID=A0A327RQ45_9FLAO|nr:lysylphosphatidylglycerol synthase domain-containing protein [Olleya aquimaris]RAJ18158.1 lysylphosphatidylglycerol synthase-like protein [Olleya aquimaris]